MAGMLVFLDLPECLGVEKQVVIGFLVLIYMHCLEICVRQQACADSFEACVGCWKKDASNIDDIARVDLSRQRSMAVNCQHSRDVANRYLISHLLDLDLPETAEISMLSSRGKVDPWSCSPCIHRRDIQSWA